MAQIDVYRAELEGCAPRSARCSDQVGGARGADRRGGGRAPTAQIETARRRRSASQTEAETALGAAESQADLALIRAAIAERAPFAEPLERLAGRRASRCPRG